MRGLPGRSAASQASRAACPCCLGRVQHRMGIYLNKGAKVGCSDQNGASSGKPGSGTLPWASTRNQAAGTESLLSHSGLGPDLLQPQGGISGGLRSSSTVGQASSLAQRSIPEARKCARCGSFGGSPGAPGFGPVPRKKPGWETLKPVKTEVSVDLSWKGPYPVSPPTSSPKRQAPLPLLGQWREWHFCLESPGKKDIYEINGNLCK